MEGQMLLAEFDWERWIGVVIVGFLALLFVVMPILMFVVALAEKNHLRALAPVPESDMPSGGAKVVDQAIVHGFIKRGTYTDGDTGIKKGYITLLLSPDEQVLAWVMHGRLAGRHKLITPLADGRWLATANITGVVDLSGLDDDAMLPEAEFDVLLYYHSRRLADTGLNVEPFDPDDLPGQLLTHQQERVELMVSNGLAKYASADQTAYRATMRGAFQLSTGYIKEIAQMGQRTKLSKAMTEEARLMGRHARYGAGTTVRPNQEQA